MHLIFHLYFGLSPCGYCYRHWSCFFVFVFYFSMQWPIHRNLTTRRISLWYAVLNVEKCARERCYECRPNTSTSSALFAKVTHRSQPTLFLYIVIVWQFSDSYIRAFIPLNAHVIETEHKTNNKKHNRCFIVQHFSKLNHSPWTGRVGHILLFWQRCTSTIEERGSLFRWLCFICLESDFIQNS